MAEALESVVRFENVCVAFDGETVLHDLSFELVKGQTLICYGAAGSGKSVMLKTALGLIKPETGRVYLFGTDVTDYSEEQLYAVRQRIGVLFQEGGLFDSLTIEENVAFPIVSREITAKQKTVKNGNLSEHVREALRFVELEHTLTKVPSELSGGMRRRVGIARAMVTDPALMLYDSPTAGLDPITANTIIALIAKARDTKKATIIIVTHRYQDGHLMANFRYNSENGELESVSRDSDIHKGTVFMVFKEGRLAFQGTQEELEKQEDPYVKNFRYSKV